MSIDRRSAREKAKEALDLAAETTEPKQAQALAAIATHWLALEQTLPDPVVQSLMDGSYL